MGRDSRGQELSAPNRPNRVQNRCNDDPSHRLPIRDCMSQGFTGQKRTLFFLVDRNSSPIALRPQTTVSYSSALSSVLEVTEVLGLPPPRTKVTRGLCPLDSTRSSRRPGCSRTNRAVLRRLRIVAASLRARARAAWPSTWAYASVRIPIIQQLKVTWGGSKGLFGPGRDTAEATQPDNAPDDGIF